MAGEADTFLLVLIAFIFPPAAAAFVTGCGADLCLNLLLTLLGYFPGCIHAMWLVLRRAEANERYGYKNWAYHGMGEFAPVGAGGLSSGPYVASYGPPPPPPPPPSSGQHPTGRPPPGPPPPAPPEQKGGGYQAPPQAPVDQKAIDVTPAPADQKLAQSTAPPAGSST